MNEDLLGTESELVDALFELYVSTTWRWYQAKKRAFLVLALHGEIGK